MYDDETPDTEEYEQAKATVGKMLKIFAAFGLFGMVVDCANKLAPQRHSASRSVIILQKVQENKYDTIATATMSSIGHDTLQIVVGQKQNFSP